MKEEFLHYLWKYRLYDPDSFFDADNTPIEVLSPGEHNPDSGPDFFNARISIGGTLWAGNVEIHTKASHFDSHGHNSDHAYDNVILHVVAENDRKIFNARGEELLTVKMEFNPDLYESYTGLINNPSTIACQGQLSSLDPFFIRHWLHSLVIERLQSKSGLLDSIYRESGNDWDETCYKAITRYFGFRVNAEPFEMLANTLPFKIIRKHSDNRMQIEALLFGSAGLLDEGLFKEAMADSYYRELIREFRILSSKYSLIPLHGWIWKFSKLRPVNFPTIRISQLAAMLTVSGGLFSRIISSESINQLRKVFEVSASAYWNDHYLFGRKSRAAVKNTGTQATDIILINAVAPLIFVYGRFHDNPLICERAISFLEEICPEENSVMKEWRKAGPEPESAFFTQALLQLVNEYCKKRRCLSCRIGSILISSGKMNF